MAPKGRAEGAGCVFPWKTRKGGRTGRDEQKNSKKIGNNERCDAADGSATLMKDANEKHITYALFFWIF